MVELLVVMGVETKDALLRAIDQEFVEAVELLLEHEELLTANLLAEETCEWSMFHPAIESFNSAKHVDNWENSKRSNLMFLIKYPCNLHL